MPKKKRSFARMFEEVDDEDDAQVTVVFQDDEAYDAFIKGIQLQAALSTLKMVRRRFTINSNETFLEWLDNRIRNAGVET